MRRLAAFGLGVVGLLGTALVLAGPASAHATVVGSDPVDSARLAKVPAVVSIDFDESVGLGSFGYLHVINSAGARVESGVAYHPDGDGTRIAVHLRAGLPHGTYTESWRVISADSHPVAGVVRFVVGNGPLVATAVPDATSTVNHPVGIALDVARWLSYAGVALLGGAWLFTVWTAGREDRRARRIVWTGWTLAAGGAVLEVLVQGAYAAGRGWGGVVDPSLVDATLHTDYGTYHSVRLVLLGVIAVMLGAALRRRSRAENLLLPLWIGVAVTFAGVGHAGTTNPAWLSMALDTTHVLAMSVWVGGLVLVLGALLPRRDVAEVGGVLPAFSRAAFTSVVVLAVTGTYAAWRGVASWRALGTTEYGLLVIGKVVLFCGLLGVANLSRVVVARRMRPRVVAYAMSDTLVADPPEAGADATDVERVRRGVLVEVVLAAVVLAVTAVLVGQPRGPETLAARALDPASATAPLGGGRSATVTVDPGQHGVVGVTITLSGPAKSVTATATQPDQQIGPVPLPLRASGTDSYEADGVDLPVSGKWVISVVVTRSVFDAVSTQATVTLS